MTVETTPLVRPAVQVDAAPARTRIIALDALRGLALVLMGLIHSAAFVRVGLQAETYGGQPAHLLGWPYWGTALLTTLAAPTFWVLSGVSVALLEASRRRAGVPEARITRFLLIRAGVILALDLTLADWFWTGGGPYTHILMAIALSLAVISIVRRLPTWALLVWAAVQLIGYQLWLPGIAANLSQTTNLALAILFSYTTVIRPAVEFSFFGWSTLLLLGYLLGRSISQTELRRPQTWIFVGLGLLATWAMLRGMGWFGDLVPYTPDQPLPYLVVMSKTPPSLTYFTFKLGWASLLLAVFYAWPAWLERLPGRWLVMCGQVSLFFFVMHIIVYNLVSQVVLALNLPGPPILRAYLAWLLGLAILLPLAGAYRRLRRRYPDSVLRYF